MLSGAAGIASFLPSSVAKAFAIDPALGSTWKDAEHVVILMQENRSFDHCYGSLRGVRGFNDPRAMTLPSKNSVFLQQNGNGETFIPFRLNLNDTKATWMGSLPHSWTDQTDARNNGAHDQWLEAKRSGHKDYEHMPLTLGFYNRHDIPFYYSLADAFTVCDQNFCSSLTGTTPNRLYLWTGKTRDDDQTAPRVRNEEADYDSEASWKTFPERLEENDISWKIYQNEVSIGVGLEGEEESWLANFGDNTIEHFTQFNVRFLPAHMRYLPQKVQGLKIEIKEGEERAGKMPQGDELTRLQRKIDYAKRELAASLSHMQKYTPENYDKLSRYQKNLHEKAFVNNIGDPDYHKLSALKYNDNGTERQMTVPKGDVFHQFRRDVKNKNLPTVSWLVAPQNFSDHPDSPWYGAWYVSEALDILTEDPEIWKKTIFILCYDENDGYFDHVPPFVSPAPNNPSTGKVSPGIDLNAEHVALDDDLKRKPPSDARGGPIGLGYRVPLVIASPWSRGGAVCSQVFDHTSILMFLEKFLSQKTKKEIKETNITEWRRTVCGDLTSTFVPYNGEKFTLPDFVEHDPFVKSIHQSQFNQAPSEFRALTQAEVDQINLKHKSSTLPRQEKGTKTSRALPYELYADGKTKKDQSYEIRFKAGKNHFGELSAGSPFQVYSYGSSFGNRAYAVIAGDTLEDTWTAQAFDQDRYHFRVHGPNGFFREFKGKVNEPGVEVLCRYETNAEKKLTGNIALTISNPGTEAVTFSVHDNSYGQRPQESRLGAGDNVTVRVDLTKSSRWYDISVTIDGNKMFENRFAGKVETGDEGISDPAMA